VEQFARSRIGQEVEFPAFEPKDVSQPSHNLIGRMAFAGLQMAYVRSRGADPARDFLLGQVQLASPVANHLAESKSFGFSHEKLLLRSQATLDASVPKPTH